MSARYFWHLIHCRFRTPNPLMGSAVGAIVGQKFIATQDGTGVNEPRRCQDDARRRSVSVLSAIGRGYVCRRESAPGGTVSPVSVSISGVPWGVRCRPLNLLGHRFFFQAEDGI